MISHEYRCIFIHIPRCAGTSIETWLCGHDWWDVEPSTKHLTAAQARHAYALWWDAYFKFTVVRDPYSRTQSLLKFPDHFGLRRKTGEPIDFSGYETLFGRDRVIEHDHRFVSRADVLSEAHRPNRVYGNILDEALDFVGRFEALESGMAIVRDRLGCPTRFHVHAEQGDRELHPLLAQDRAWIASTYAKDFDTYGYPR